RTLTDRHNRAIAGLSMGSGQALQIALRHLERFSWLGLFSGSAISGDLKTAYQGVFANPAEINRRLHLIWMGGGTVETRVTQAIDASLALLQQAAIKNVVTFKSEG